MEKRSVWLLLSLTLLLAVFIRIPLMSVRQMMLPGDEVMFGLMARRILHGDFPIYYLGQSYLGTLEAYVTALLSLATGMNGWTVQMGGLLFYLLFLATHFFLTKKLFGWKTCLFSSLLLVIAPVMFWELSVRAMGGYTEILFFGALAFLLWLKVFSDGETKFLFPLGLALGIALWLNPLFLVYLIPLGIMTLYWHQGFQNRSPWLRPSSLFFLRGFRIPAWLRIVLLCVHAIVLLYVVEQIFIFFIGGRQAPPFHWKICRKFLIVLAGEASLLAFWNAGGDKVVHWLKKYARCIVGFILGYSPALLYSLMGTEGYRILQGSGSISADQFADRVKFAYLQMIPRRIWGIPMPQTAVQWGPIIWAGIFLGFFLIAIGFYFFCHRKGWASFFKVEKGIQEGGFFFCLLAASVLAITTASSLFADRYFQYFYWVSAIAAGFLLDKLFSYSKALAVLFAALLAGQYAWSAADFVRSYPKPRMEELIRVLEKENVQGGFADYDNAYELSFYSQEKLKFIPLEGHARLSEYPSFVNALEKKAYVFSDRDLEARFRAAHPGVVLTPLRELGPHRIYVTS